MSRNYVVGLPVGVTVHEDGRVHLSVDVGDLTHKALRESEDGMDPKDQYAEEEVIADSDAIDRATEDNAVTAGVMHQENALTTGSHYFADEDGYGNAALWRSNADDDAAPELVLTLATLPESARHLWPVLLAAVGA